MTPLEIKQAQFNAAMDRYENTLTYKLIDKTIAIVNVVLQAVLLWKILPVTIGVELQIAAFVLAYLLADFINGLIHLYMDRNDDYESIAGPLIAKFHLHHKTPRYKDNSVPVVYFNETGAKVWLAFYLSIVALLSSLPDISPFGLCILVYFGVLSSVAEVSHYLCHNSNSPTALFLSRVGILLSKSQHGRHHLEDNVNYTFLNGISDPLVNAVARRWSCGYKQGTDLHFARYDAQNRPPA